LEPLEDVRFINTSIHRGVSAETFLP